MSLLLFVGGSGFVIVRVITLRAVGGVIGWPLCDTIPDFLPVAMAVIRSENYVVGFDAELPTFGRERRVVEIAVLCR